jgi:hypothetical protein
MDLRKGMTRTELRGLVYRRAVCQRCKCTFLTWRLPEDPPPKRGERQLCESCLAKADKPVSLNRITKRDKEQQPLLPFPVED